MVRLLYLTVPTHGQITISYCAYSWLDYYSLLCLPMARLLYLTVPTHGQITTISYCAPMARLLHLKVPTHDKITISYCVYPWLDSISYCTYSWLDYYILLCLPMAKLLYLTVPTHGQITTISYCAYPWLDYYILMCLPMARLLYLTVPTHGQITTISYCAPMARLLYLTVPTHGQITISYCTYTWIDYYYILLCSHGQITISYCVYPWLDYYILIKYTIHLGMHFLMHWCRELSPSPIKLGKVQRKLKVVLNHQSFCGHVGKLPCLFRVPDDDFVRVLCWVSLALCMCVDSSSSSPLHTLTHTREECWQSSTLRDVVSDVVNICSYNNTIEVISARKHSVL